MIWDALQITLIGMGGVFAFLVLLIIGMSVLRRIVGSFNDNECDKIAVAIAIARSQGGFR